MTYKTRQEVFRAAADWMDVCEASGIEAMCKFLGNVTPMSNRSWDSDLEDYEFPLALLEGKEVWVGSELYWDDGSKATVTEGWNSKANWKLLSWNPPKPKTVMVELDVADAEKMSRDANERLAGTYAYDRVGLACKKALENLK